VETSNTIKVSYSLNYQLRDLLELLGSPKRVKEALAALEAETKKNETALRALESAEQKHNARVWQKLGGGDVLTRVDEDKSLEEKLELVELFRAKLEKDRIKQDANVAKQMATLDEYQYKVEAK
jgi:hypothetical protein